MKTSSHVTLLPEALVASNLTPGQFGRSYATGQRHEARGQATVREVHPALHQAAFNIDEALR